MAPVIERSARLDGEIVALDDDGRPNLHKLLFRREARCDDAMTKGEQARLTAWRLEVPRQDTEEQNVTRVCRRFGISRKSFYQVESAASRARRRRLIRSTRDAAAIASGNGSGGGQQLYLRQHYHFGPARIATYLDRFHRIEIAGSSVHRILKRHG